MSTSDYRLNQFYPHTVIKYGGEYWHSRPEMINELAEHFDYHYFCHVVKQKDIDKQIYKPLSSAITVHDFFNDISPKHYYKNRKKYRRKIEDLCNTETDLFLINYPFYKTGVLLTHQLQDTNLIIWVLSDYVGQFGLEDEGMLRNTVKKLLKPFISYVYPRMTAKLFSENLVFYTGDILYETDTPQNQHAITEVATLNQDKSRIQREFCNEIVFVGRENRQKGIDLAIKAINQAERDLTLNVIGLDSLTTFTDLDTENVDFHGTIYDDEIFFNLLTENDFLLMPSTAEKQGKVQLEAMSGGVVPICANSGGIPFTVEHNYNGLLFEERSLSGLLDCLRIGYSFPELYERLIEGGVETTQTLSAQTQSAKMSNIIKNHYGR